MVFSRAGGNASHINIHTTSLCPSLSPYTYLFFIYIYIIHIFVHMFGRRAPGQSLAIATAHWQKPHCAVDRKHHDTTRSRTIQRTDKHKHYNICSPAQIASRQSLATAAVQRHGAHCTTDRRHHDMPRMRITLKNPQAPGENSWQ